MTYRCYQDLGKPREPPSLLAALDEAHAGFCARYGRPPAGLLIAPQSAETLNALHEIEGVPVREDARVPRSGFVVWAGPVPTL